MHWVVISGLFEGVPGRGGEDEGGAAFTTGDETISATAATMMIEGYMRTNDAIDDDVGVEKRVTSFVI